MPNQDNQNHVKSNVTAIFADKEDTSLSFVGCENCQARCCRLLRGKVSLDELHDVAQLFPVVFLRKKKRKIVMRFLMSLDQKIYCPYLDSNSRKCTIYEERPRTCRTYPFGIGYQTLHGTNTIVCDQGRCPGFQKSLEGLQLTNGEGKVSNDIIDNFIGREILANHKKNYDATDEFLKLVRKLDLLFPMPHEIARPGIGSYYIISEKKLAALDADSMKLLQTTGYINAINIQRKSLIKFSIFNKSIPAKTAFGKHAYTANI
jgi:Fe-S-cluster containining protein